MKDSNNGLIIMLNCNHQMLRKTTQEEFKTFYGKGYYSSVCRENNRLLNGLQLLEGL